MKLKKLLIAATISFFIAGLAASGWSAETTNLRLAKPAKGDRNWGQTVNDNMDKIDSAVGTIQSKSDDLPEVYVYTGTFNSTTGYQISLPKAVDNVNEYAVKVTPTTRAGAIGDIYVTKTTSNFTVKCSEANTTDTFSASVYYIGDVSAYGSSIYRKWYVSPVQFGTADHADSSQTGSLAWIQAQIGTTPATVELPGNKNYQLKQSLTVADNIQLAFQRGGIIDTDFSIRNSNYEWYQNGATNEYYLQANGGGNPNINMPSVVIENNAQMTGGAAGSLAAGEWDWNDVNGLGYTTVYVRLSDSADPDGKSADYVEAGYTLTINSLPDYPARQIISGEGLLRFSFVEKVYPEWVGAAGDGSTNDYNAFRILYDSLLHSRGGIFQMLAKRYVIDSPLVLGLAGNLDVPIVFQGIKGSTSEGSIIQIDGISSSHALFEQNQGGYLYNHIFRDFSINGAVYGSEVVCAADAFRLEYINSFHFDNLYIKACHTAFYITGQDADRISIKRSKMAGNGQDIYFSAPAATYQIHIEDCEFVNTKNGPSVDFISGCSAKYTTFRNCSWVACEYETVKSVNGSNIFELQFDMAYSEQNCHTSGDYAFSLNGSIRGLMIRNSTLGEINCAEAALNIGDTRSPIIMGCALGISGSVRALDLGDGSGTLYNPILIGNSLFADGSGDRVKKIAGSTIRNLVAIGNVPNDLGMENTIFATSDDYTDSLQGVSLVQRKITKDLNANDTFTVEDGHIHRINPLDGNYNWNPSGIFPNGFEIEIINIGGTHTVTFDSAGRNFIMPISSTAKFIYDINEWRKMYDNSLN